MIAIDALAETLEHWQDRLEEYGVDEGFHVATRALERGCGVPLAHWLRDYAGGMGKTSFEDFAVHVWAGDAWDAIREDLLAHLARAPHAYDRTCICLPKA